ncbi:putative transposase [Francisella tularensis]|uniref:Transposase n=1 Tax=Francisella tularensis TaxID=263 RepID=A0AAW3D3K9_FRATU|nr:putative transposase [Francisella tularensis]
MQVHLDIKEALAPDIPRSTFYDCLNRLGFSFKKRLQNISKEKNMKGWSI